MSLMDEIYRNRINVKQLIILFDAIKRVFALSLSSFSDRRLFNGECAEIHALLFLPRLIEAGNSIISLLFFSVSLEEKTEQKVPRLMTIDYLCLPITFSLKPKIIYLESFKRRRSGTREEDGAEGSKKMIQEEHQNISGDSLHGSEEQQKV